MRFDMPLKHYVESDDATETICGLLTKNHEDHCKTGTRNAIIIQSERSGVSCNRCRMALINRNRNS